MVKVKLFGLLRLDAGIKELELEAKCVKDIYPQLLEQVHASNPLTKITSKDIDGCIIVINGVQSKKSSRLSDGDEVMLMSPVCGG